MRETWEGQKKKEKRRKNATRNAQPIMQGMKLNTMKPFNFDSMTLVMLTGRGLELTRELSACY